MVLKCGTKDAAAFNAKLAEGDDVGSLLEDGEQDFGCAAWSATVQDVPEKYSQGGGVEELSRRGGRKVRGSQCTAIGRNTLVFMPRVVPITEFDLSTHPLLADYADLTDAQLRGRDLKGEQLHFIAEGEGVVRHLIASRFQTRSLLVTPHHVAEKMADIVPTLGDDVTVFVALPQLVEAITGFPFHRGVIASGAVGRPHAAETLIANASLLVVCERLSNIENMGAVFRNVACLAGENAAVLLSPESCHPLYRKSLRVSMGHALRVPYAHLVGWPDSLQMLRRAGFRLLALTPRRDAADIAAAAAMIDSHHPGVRVALLVGAEGPGLSEGAIGAADLAVKIPMQPGADSLNVATALAIALHAVRK